MGGQQMGEPDGGSWACAENLLTDTERSWAMPLRVMRTMRGEGDEDDAE